MEVKKDSINSMNIFFYFFFVVAFKVFDSNEAGFSQKERKKNCEFHCNEKKREKNSL